MARTIALDNDFLARFTITDEQTGLVPSPALSGIKCRISTTRDGATIHAEVDIDMSDTDGTTGITEGVFQGTDINTHLASLTGRKVFMTVYKAADVKAFVPLLVVETRAAS